MSEPDALWHLAVGSLRMLCRMQTVQPLSTEMRSVRFSGVPGFWDLSGDCTHPGAQAASLLHQKREKPGVPA